MNKSPIRYLRGLLTSIALMLALGACKTEQTVVPLGEYFGLERRGSPMPHSSTIVSLLHRSGKGWDTVWPAISFRCDNPISWQNAALFGGVTRERQAEEGQVRLLYYHPDVGVVDVSNAIREYAKKGGNGNLTFIKLRMDHTLVMLSLIGEQPVDLRIPAADLDAIARTVVAMNRKRTFDGIKLWE